MPVVGYYNGQYVDPATASIPIDERGHQFGDGVYEVIRVYNGRPFLLKWHTERLLTSLQAIRIAAPHDATEFEDLILSVLAKSEEPEAAIYLQVTRGEAIRGHLFPEKFTTRPSVSMTVRPVVANRNPLEVGKLLLQPDERWTNAYIKTLQLLPNILAKQAAHDAGADEALLVRDGCMIEAASSNLWFVRGGELITAPTDRFILPGITRRYVLELAAKLQIPVRQEKLALEELETVDAIFITGTLTEIYPIDTVLSHPQLLISDPVPGVAPHPLDIEPSACTVIWQAEDFTLVDRLREEFNYHIATFRSEQRSS